VLKTGDNLVGAEKKVIPSLSVSTVTCPHVFTLAQKGRSPIRQRGANSCRPDRV
jgi:hypothetical protein